jgi:POT family proton-dependent oligopeptide transporter
MNTTKQASTAHPRKAFVVLFLIEIWERFGYYGAASLLVLFMVERYRLTDTRATLIWGAFSALVYSMPMIGGYIGDRILGARRTMVLGAITLGLGYLLLAVPLPTTFFGAMGLIAIGNGLFKVNPNNLVSRLYEGDESKLDVVFTLYYMSLNIGSFVSIWLTPFVKNHPSWGFHFLGIYVDSWHLAFGLSAIGLTLGLLNYGVFKRYVKPYGTKPDFQRLHVGKLGGIIGGTVIAAYILAQIIQHKAVAIGVVALLALIMIGIFVKLIAGGEKTQRNRIVACVIFTAMSIIWAIYNQQIYTSLTLFALRNVHHEIAGFHVAPAQFQDLNQFWLIVFSPILAWLYHRMMKSKRGDFSIATKYAAGLYLVGGAYLLYAASGWTAHGGMVSSWWLVAGYAFQSLGELLISALGFSMVTRLVPERVRGILMGAWFLGMGVSLYIGGAIASLASVPTGVTDPVQTLSIYVTLFFWLGIGAVAAAIIATLLIPLLKRLMVDPNLANTDVSKPSLNQASALSSSEMNRPTSFR